jgi:hypothetical protein
MAVSSAVPPQEGYALEQNYPNPFNGISDVGYRISESAWVKLQVFDLLGREVAVLADEWKTAGRYTVRFDASRLSSGVYLCRMQVLDAGRHRAAGGQPGSSQVKKLLLVR